MSKRTEPRYVVEVDNERECYKLIDTHQQVGEGDEADNVLIAEVYEEDDAERIRALLEQWHKLSVVKEIIKTHVLAESPDVNRKNLGEIIDKKLTLEACARVEDIN